MDDDKTNNVTSNEAIVDYEFGTFRLSLQEGCLLQAGKAIHLQPKSFELLHYLLQRAGQLVGREELMDALWGSSVVTDNSLTQCIRQVRAALEEGKDSTVSIETVPKRGFRLLGKVRVIKLNNNSSAKTASEQPHKLGNWLFTAAGLLLVGIAYVYIANLQDSALPGKGVQEPSLAVLPFRDSSANGDQGYFSDGISEELLNLLAKVSELRVISRTSSFVFRDDKVDIPAIAKKLNVTHILEGSVRVSEDRVRILAQLIDARSDRQIWSEVYDRKLDEVFAIQDEIAGIVVKRLKGTLLDPNPETHSSAQQVSAYDLLLLGRQYEQRVTNQQLVDEPNLQLAIDYYQQVIAADPKSAEAHARLGKMLLYQGDIDAANKPILRALELDPQLSDAHATLGLYYWITRQDGIGAAYLRAVELNPNNADALSYYASWLWLQSKVDESIDHYRKARDVDPVSLIRYADLGYIQAFQARSDEAQEVVARIFQLFPTAPGYLAAARISEAYGAADEAISYAHKARLLRPDDPDITGQLAEMYARIGDFDRARLLEPKPGMGQLFWQRRYDELIDLGEELVIDRPGDTDVLLLLAFAYNTKGRFEDSLRILNLARMPDAAMSESRRANELHALMTLAGALEAIGDKEGSDGLATYELKRNHKFGVILGEGSKTSHLIEACNLAVLGKDAEALTWLENLNHLDGAIWLPWLKDQACFQSFADEPRYQAVVTALEDRLAVIRQRLPLTLERQGLVPSQPD